MPIHLMGLLYVKPLTHLEEASVFHMMALRSPFPNGTRLNYKEGLHDLLKDKAPGIMSRRDSVPGSYPRWSWHSPTTPL